MKNVPHIILFLFIALFFTSSSLGGINLAPLVHAVSCVRSDTGNTLLNSVCTLDGVPKYDVNGTETTRVGIINTGDLTVSGADVTVQPNTTIVWPTGYSINIQSGGRIILGSGASLTQGEPKTYLFQSLGFTLNAAGDPVKVVNNNLQICSGTSCTVALPAGNGNIVVEGVIKYADGTTQSTAATSGVGGSGSSGYLSKFTAGTTLANSIVYDTGVNVGIGSTSPGTKLEVAGNINSSTGAIQTAGITRIANDGVGTFATGTTIGGAAVASIPAGAVMAFNLASCPTGWTEFTALRGRVAVGTPLSGTNAGTVGTALTNLEDRTHTHTTSDHTLSITEMPAHTHSASTWNAYQWGNYFGGGATNYGPGSATTNSTGGGGAHNHGDTSATSATVPYIQLLMCQKS